MWSILLIGEILSSIAVVLINRNRNIYNIYILKKLAFYISSSIFVRLIWIICNIRILKGVQFRVIP